jgi:hypothetical protein
VGDGQRVFCPHQDVAYQSGQWPGEPQSALPVYAAPGGVCAALTHHDLLGLLSVLPQQVQRDQALLGNLEQHWNGALLDAVDAVVQYARIMTWREKYPVVALVTTTYQTGIKLTKKEMQGIETQLQRLQHLDKWFVDLGCPSLDIRDT